MPKRDRAAPKTNRGLSCIKGHALGVHWLLSLDLRLLALWRELA